MKQILNVPLFGVLLAAINVMTFWVSDPNLFFNRVVIEFRLISGSVFQLNIKELLIIIGLNFLYFEVFKSIRTSVSAMIDHVLSMIVFIVYLVEFIVVKKLGTSTFLILTFMSLVEVLAGFTITVSTARRDITLEK